MKRYPGVRERGAGSYGVNFRPTKGAKAVWKTVQASSPKEASLKRAELILAAAKSPVASPEQRDSTTFETIWPVVERNIIADGLTRKTQLQLKKVYDRLFTEFRNLKYPHIKNPSQLQLPFFLEYKSYYGVELGRAKGLRAETQRTKILMHRMRKLRFCSEELMRDLKEVKTPERRKKAYPEINATAIKSLFAYIKNDRPDFYGPLYFMFRTGRRVEETTLIERKDIIWEGINPVKINIRAETTKMNTAAPLNFLDEDLRNHIRAYYQISNKHKSPYLFLNRSMGYCKNEKIKMNSLTEYFGSLTQREDMLKVRITCHYLRHRFCTETCKAKLPLVDIQAISGIKDIATLIQNYCHSSQDGQASVLERTKLI